MSSVFRLSPHLAATFLLLAGTLAASRLMAHRKSEMLAQPLANIERNIAGFKGVENPALDEPTMHALKPTSYLSRTYSNGNWSAELFIASTRSSAPARACTPPSTACRAPAGKSGTTTPWKFPRLERSTPKYSISRESERRLVLYWYQSRDRIIASEYLGKLLLARDTLLQNATAASMVRLILPDQPGTSETARNFASELIPQVQVCFGR